MKIHTTHLALATIRTLPFLSGTELASNLDAVCAFVSGLDKEAQGQCLSKYETANALLREMNAVKDELVRCRASLARAAK